MKWGTSNCANYSTWNPKRSARYVYHIGTSASSTARAGISCDKEQRIIRYLFNTQWISFLFLSTERATPRAPLREEARGQNTTSPIHSRSAKKYYLGFHDRSIRDEKFRQNMIDNGRTQESCRQMDDLAEEDHSHYNSRRN